MVGEVNKIIFNSLVSGRGIFLPQVGSLYIERQAARKITDNKYQSPRNIVVFSSKEMAVSLVQEIINVASCSEQQAADIYQRWLDKSRQDNRVMIGGVGELVDKSFRMEEEFAQVINPKGIRTIVVRRRFHWLFFLISILCILAAVGIFIYANSFVDNEPVDAEKPSVKQSTEVKIDVAEDSLQVVVPITQAAVEQDKAAVANQEPNAVPKSDAAEQQGSQPTVQNNQSPQYAFYVVGGVYADQNNVPKAINQLKANLPAAKFAILPYKGKFMITALGSDNYDECQQFINTYQTRQNGLWIYRAR